jgi:hypothetical protein
MTINKAKAIITSHDCPPVPLRGADWSARFEWYGPDEEDQPVGLGETEAKAVLDLLTNGAAINDPDGSIMDEIVNFAYVGACIDLGIDQ